VTLGGRRVPVRRPRVRTVGDDEHELSLESYDAFVSGNLLADGVVARMLGGLSTRGYPVGLKPVGQQAERTATGTSHSAVSRRFVTATAERLDQLLHRPLDGQRWLVVFLDGFGTGEHLLVGALGVTADGTEVPPGRWATPARPARSWSSWPARWPVSGLVLPHPCARGWPRP
jgi:putative transposase